MLRVYYADISDVPAAGDGLCLSAYRLEKLSKQRTALHRRQGIGAELLLMYALREAGVQILPPELFILPGGKPVLLETPLHFNLSHSGYLAACALSDRPVGLDLEREGRMRQAVLERCFSRTEQKLVLESEDPDAAFTRLWTGKESILKASGAGIREALDQVCAQALPTGMHLWQTRLSGKPVSARDSEAAFMTETAGYQLSVCYKGDQSEPDLVVQVPVQRLLSLS